MRLRQKLRSGCVIPAHPLALNSNHRLDERRQRALTVTISLRRWGIAVGVHTTSSRFATGVWIVGARAHDRKRRRSGP